METCVARKGCISRRVAPCDTTSARYVRRAVLVNSSLKIVGTVIANFVAVGSALALTSPSLSDLQKYQDEYAAATAKAAAQAVEATKAIDVPAIDFNSMDATSDTATLIAGLAVGSAIAGAGVSVLLGAKGPKVQGISPAKAIDLLANNPSAELLDIRTQAEIKESGSPDLRSVKKPIITLPYVPVAPTSGGTVMLGWADKLRRSNKVTEETQVILLSSYTPESLEAAKLAAEVYPEASSVYYVIDGTEGPKGWKESGLPWREPMKLNLPDLSSLKALDFTGVAAGTEKIVKKYQENPTLVNGAVAAVAVAAASVFLFTEMETILELVGVVAALQFLASKLLFADDRQKTFSDLKSLITEKIAADEAGSDLKQLASTILEVETVEEVAKLSNGLSNGSSGNGGVPPNVKEAREWISKWRSKQRSNAFV